MLNDQKGGLRLNGHEHLAEHAQNGACSPRTLLKLMASRRRRWRKFCSAVKAACCIRNMETTAVIR